MFGRAVAAEGGDARCGGPLAELPGDRRGTDHEFAQAGELGVGGREVENAGEMEGGATGGGDGVPLDEVHGPAWIPRVHVDHLAAVQQRAQHTADPCHVAGRERDELHIVGSGAEDQRRGPLFREQRVMAVLNPFGCGGGAGGVDEQAHVVRVDGRRDVIVVPIERRPRQGPVGHVVAHDDDVPEGVDAAQSSDPFRVIGRTPAIRHDEHLGPGLFENERDLAGPVDVHNGNEDRAGEKRGGVSDGALVPVGQLDGHRVTRSDTESLQCRGDGDGVPQDVPHARGAHVVATGEDDRGVRMPRRGRGERLRAGLPGVPAVPVPLRPQGGRVVGGHVRGGRHSPSR